MVQKLRPILGLSELQILNRLFIEATCDKAVRTSSIFRGRITHLGLPFTRNERAHN